MPRKLVVGSDEEEKQRFDTYVNATITEVLAAFHRARRSVVGAQLQFIGYLALKEHPDLVHNFPTGESAAALSRATENDFW